jgi:hypothetical protein
MKYRLGTSQAEILAAVPKARMDKVITEARQRTGAAPNPDRTDIHWVRILGRRSNG